MRVRNYRFPVLVLVLAFSLGACADEDGAEATASDSTVAQAGAVADDPGARGRDIDRRIFEEKMELARSERLDTLPLGSIMVRIGESFLGTKYTPGTLEVEPEQLVTNLEELDCVTFVENVLAMARIIRAGTPTWDAHVRELTRIRYRGGELDGYVSRLHYFSEWISDNARLGLVRNVTRDLGGVPLTEPIDFMTTHRESYRQLADSAIFTEIQRIEARLSGEQRWWIPEQALAGVMPRLQNGDIIAATSAIDGLDIAHTGIAVVRPDGVYLMHAPLIGASVEMSETPIDQRIAGIEAQDGIMVARPL